MEILSAKALCKSYGSGENQVKALDHVSLSVENGEFVAVIGIRQRQVHPAESSGRTGYADFRRSSGRWQRSLSDGR